MSFKRTVTTGLFVAAVCMSWTGPAVAQDASITAHGAYGTVTNSYICPAIAMFSHGEIAFDLLVTGKQGSPREATGTLWTRCIGFNSHIDSTSIDTIVQMTDTTAWVRALYDLGTAGYLNCVDRRGQATHLIVLDIQLQAGTAGTTASPAIHVSSTLPAGGISCDDSSSGETVVFQNFDGGVRPLTSGSISITPSRRTGSD
jgi:hypothetical protein